MRRQGLAATTRRQSLAATGHPHCSCLGMVGSSPGISAASLQLLRMELSMAGAQQPTAAPASASSTLRRSARDTRLAQTYVGQDEEEERGANDSDWSASREDEGDSDTESDA
eukprot:g8694.t1